MVGQPASASVPAASESSDGSGATSLPSKPRRFRRVVLVAAVVIVALSVASASLYVEIHAGGSTGVLVNGISVVSNYTNAPAGQSPTSPFQFYFGWFNATAESPTVTTIQAPPSSVVRLSFTIDDDVALGAGVPGNCSVNGFVALTPFGIASLTGQFKTAAWSAHPFPFNFSGEYLGRNPSANLFVNVTLPAQSGEYTPTFVLDIACEQYS
jgi:hypothetical protein